MPVDICAGRGDGIIAKDNVRMHYDAMASGGCHVTYKEFDFGHLDFTFAGTDCPVPCTPDLTPLPPIAVPRDCRVVLHSTGWHSFMFLC